MDNTKSIMDNTINIKRDYDITTGAQLALENEIKDKALMNKLLSESWGASESIETTDITVAKILQQQALSKFVADGVAMAGDWCDSLTGEVLCKKDQGLEVIIFDAFKKLLVKHYDLQNKETKTEIIDINASTINLPWDEVVVGGRIKRFCNTIIFVYCQIKFLDYLTF